MIPKISHTVERDGLACFVTTDAVVGAFVRVPLIDTESESAEEKIQRLRRWMRTLPSEVLVRFSLISREMNEAVGEGFRSDSVARLGWVRNEMIVSVEARGDSKLVSDVKRVIGLDVLGVESRLSSVSSALWDLKSAGVDLVPLSMAETKAKFFWESGRGFRVCSSFLDFRDEVVGVVRLQKQTAGALSPFALASALTSIPRPFEVAVSCRRMDQVRREFIVRTRLKQEESGLDRISRVKAEATEAVLENTFLQGAEMFEFEFMVTLRASSEESLRSKFREAEEALSALGEVRAESFGCLPSWAATMAGTNQHVPLLEMDEALLAYLPLATIGEPQAAAAPSRSMLTHRKDGSLAAIDLFSAGAINANAVIVGSSGKGKSVMTGLLTSSLLADPQIRVIKVDVGGSHSRECELFGGREFSMSLDRPSGINPFSMVKHNDSEGARAILGKFIEVLVLEDGEITLPKAVRVEIDEMLDSYLGSTPKTAGLEGLFASAPNFSRRPLLSRWCGRGLYGKAFAEDGCGDECDPRLRYFNFSQIFQAGDADFSQAGMAAVLAQFNLELLRNPGSRLVLICDETPFFIERCFEFFKFSMANVRKFGASIVLVVQLSQHLVKGGDTGLLENAFHRFLFSADGDPEAFIKRFGSDARLVEKIRELNPAPGERSEVVYQFGDETRTLVLKLTPEEFWRVTSSQGDRIKIQKLREAVPELSLEDALSCLARIG